jgi:hypothetical protein
MPKAPKQAKGQPNSFQLTGVAGVHFVAAYLSFLGFHAVPTTRNVPGPDLLVSSLDGFQSLTLQVKTTLWAERTRGRGESKQPHHLEWEVGPSSALINNPNVWFAFVDLKRFEKLPDAYIVPSKLICEHFKYWVARFKKWNKPPMTRYRWHPELKPSGWPDLKPVPPFIPLDAYKNARGWERLKNELRAK